MFADFFNSFINGGASMISSGMSLLPTSPFSASTVAPYTDNAIVQNGFSWLNWFIPVGTLLGIIGAWVACIIAYNVFKAVVTWLSIARG